MKITLHSVNHSGPRKNRYCGPSALSAITGLSTGDTAALLRKVSSKRSIKGTHTRHMKVALEWLGYRTGCDFDYEHLPAKGRPTLLQWAKRREKVSETYLLSVGHHWAVVQGRRYVCGIIGGIVSLKQSPKKRARVKAAWRVYRHTEVKPETVIPVVVRKPDTERKVRAQAKALIIEYNLNVDEPNKGDDLFWVYPPDTVDGRPFPDPRADEHYAYGWGDVLDLAREYAAAIKAFRAEANTPAESRVNPSIETIGVDSGAEPVKLLA